MEDCIFRLEPCKGIHQNKNVPKSVLFSCSSLPRPQDRKIEDDPLPPGKSKLGNIRNLDTFESCFKIKAIFQLFELGKT